MVMGYARKLADRFNQDLRYITPALPGIGAFGLMGFPLYYLIWSYIFPQPYENLPLRIVGALFGLGLVVLKYWPDGLKRYLSLYWYLAVLFALPFFFVFMLLANGGNTVWLMSTMAAVFIAALVLDWENLVVQFLLGSALAFGAYWLVYGELSAFPIVLEHLPIYLFAIVGAAAFNYTKELVNESKRGMYFKIGAAIAHELRSPLLAIKMQLRVAKRWLPDLAGEEPAKGKRRKSRLSGVTTAIESADKQVDDSFTIIDMMLMNVNRRAQQLSDDGVHHVHDCIEKAVNGFPYKSSSQRAIVRWAPGEDFPFEGSGLLVVHVLYNLIKNAIHYANAADKQEGAEVVLTSEVSGGMGIVRVRDNGNGIPGDRIKDVFDWFYSSGGTNANAGVGLPFSKMAMDSIGGRIECRSEEGVYTEFVLSFPLRRPEG